MTKTMTDGGDGHTKVSTDFLRGYLKSQPLVTPTEVQIDEDRLYAFEAQFITTFPDKPDTVCLLLSGFNCGYGGTGPHGSIEALKFLGDTFGLTYDEDSIRRAVTGHKHVKADLRGGAIKVEAN